MTRCVVLVGALWSLTLASADELSRSARHSRKLAEQIDQLIHQLDDDAFEIREQASGKLREIGKPALSALQEATKSSSAEVRFRARALVDFIKRYKLYTVSRDGRLYRIDVGKNHMKISPVAKLGEPFDNPDVRLEGLALAPDGVLYATAVLHSREERPTRLYRLDPRTGALTFVGESAATEVDGLDFAADGKLYGAFSSGSKSQEVGLTQIVSIDIKTGKASSTATEITFKDVDALAISPKGTVVVTDGKKGLFSVNPLCKNELTSVLDDYQFHRFLSRNDEMEGLCITGDGTIFGLCHTKRTFLVRVDPKSGQVTKIGDLGFAALCLAADKRAENIQYESKKRN